MITTKPFGTTKDGKTATLYTVDSGEARISITDFGATIVNFEVKDRNGVWTDVVLGCDKAADYDGNDAYFGATVGRFAGRIEHSRFTLNGKEYTLTANKGPHSIHGGVKGLSYRYFDVKELDDALEMSIVSADGEEGYPGELTLRVLFTLQGSAITIEYFAESSKDTLLNLTNHAYFNLNGGASGTTILNHVFSIDADAFCEADDTAMPTGAILPVRGTNMDFREPVLLGSRIPYQDNATAHPGGGIDNNYVLGLSRGEFKKAATLYNPDNGIFLTCLTDQPAVQIYTGNATDAMGKNGIHYGTYSAFCMETQEFPNSPAFRHFPSSLLKAGERYYSKTTYAFSVK